MPPYDPDDLAQHATTTKLSDVARVAGVSVSTASRALTRPEMVSPETRAAVQQAAQRVGYHPNLIARSLRTQSTNSIFVMLPSLASPFYPEIIRGLDWAAHERGYTLMLGLTGSEPGRQATYIDIAHRSRADGIVVLDAALMKILESSSKMRLPAVHVLERVAGSQFPAVTIDERAAAEAITRHLIDLGHRRIAHITGSPASTVTASRLKGYRDALAQAGLDFEDELAPAGNFLVTGGKCCVAKLMALARPPTAIFCANDETALGAMTRLAELGHKVPDDVSIAGFDDIDQSAQCNPALTTVRQPRFDIGTTAMSLLLDVINGKSERPLHVQLPTELVLRKSTGRPNSRSA